MYSPRSLGLATALLWSSASLAAEGAPPFLKEPSSGMEFVLVPGGCFRMGDIYGDFREGDSEAPALPVHEVCVNALYVGKYEVTVGQWRKVMTRDPSRPFSCKEELCPADNVTFAEIEEFIRRLNAKAGGQRYRLPTEAEWEYAARSGGRVERYSGGNDVESVSFFDCATRGGSCVHPVGSKLPNGLGLYDMSGNVYEVTGDWLANDYYATSPRDDPKGPETGKYRVERGGCGSGGPRNSRVARRRYHPDPSESSGFRLVRIP